MTLYSPDTVFAAEPTPQQAPAPQAEIAPTKPDGAEGAEKPALTSIPTPAASRELFEAIRAEREAKESRARQEEATQGAIKRAEVAEAKIARLARDKEDILLNTVGYLKDLGIEDPKDQLLVAEAIMFTHVPDRAPPGHRASVIEAQMKRDRLLAERKETERGKAQEAEAQAQAQRQGQDLERRYTEELVSTVKAATAGTFPVTQAWFAGDHDAHTRELLVTARELAVAAHNAGKQADLSPQAVAKTLETRYAERVRRAVGTQAPEIAEQPAPQAETSSLVLPATPKAPVAPLSEQARIDRAIKAAFARP